MFYTYILRSLIDQRTYVGHTNNIKNRVNRHNSVLVKSTKTRCPLKLIYLEQHSTLQKAKPPVFDTHLWICNGITLS
ncbi:MAG: GIY-YIG nuclease family protein [bacterium]|nr:GIY-YIG nuclease family protein [bacterium]